MKCFPELTGGGQAVIKIPKDYRPSYYYNSGWDWEDGYPFFFESEFSWDVSIEFPYGYTNDEKWISVSQQDEGYYLKVDSKTALPETATLVLTCTSDSDIAPIEIPIEGFNLVTLRKDGYYLDPDDWTRYIFMTSGETSVFTAEIRLPSWLEMVPDSFCWTVLEDGDEDESVSYEVGQDNSLTVTAGDRGFSVDGSIKFLDQILEDGEEYEHSGYVCIDVMPRHIPLKWNNVDWNMKVLMLTYDETVTIQADLSGISTEDIDTFEWSWDHDAYGSGYMDFIIPTDDPHSVDVSAGSWSDGATLDLSVTMKDGTVYYSSCYIVVSPIIIELKKNGMRLYGDPIVLSPGEHCELKASLNLESISEDYTAKWRVETNKYISVYSYGFSPYETTVTAEAPGDDYAIFEIWEQWGYYSHQTDLRYSLEYPVHVLLEDQ